MGTIPSSAKRVALNEIGRGDPRILEALMEVMETEKLIESHAPVEWLPAGASFIVQLGGDGENVTKAPPS